MKVVVTGGLGSIGQCLVSRLSAKEHRVLVLDDESSGIRSSLPKSSNVTFEHMDITNKEKFDRVVESFKPEYVFHLAAHFANQNSVEHPYSDLNVNVIGTINVLEASRKLSGLKKVVYASSSCVYGADDEVMCEDAKVYPHETPYAINKFAAELYVKYYAWYYGVPSISLRIFNTYGPGEMAGVYRNVIPKFIDAALKGETITITGTGKETRDFTYVTDTVALFLKAAFSSEAEGDVFNGGSGLEVTILELAQMIIRQSNSKSKLIFREKRDWDQVSRRCSNISHAVKRLGYCPNVSLAEGLKKTIEWYRAQIQ